MNPQERTGRHPVLELPALKEPRGRSLILSLARNVVICRRVRWRKPLVDVLFYLGPWVEFSLYNEHDTVRKTTDTLLPLHRVLLAAWPCWLYQRLSGRVFSSMMWAG
jgi:hypothetical protein